MADGTSYSIDVSVQNIGVTTSADELNKLADNLDAASATSTQFTSAIERTKQLLASAGTAATAAADAVAMGQTKYNQLEAAATRAAKAVEKAALAGKDTSALQASADAAAAAVRGEASALDVLKTKSTAADAAQKKLEGTLKSLESAHKGAADKIKKGGASLEETTALAKGAMGPMGGLYEKVTLVGKGLSKGGVAGYAILAGVAFVALTAAIVTATVQLAIFAVTSNKKAMERLGKATEKAQKNFAKLFTGVHVDKFVAGVEQVLDIFDESTSEATALKTIISALLNPLFDSSSSLVPIVREMFTGMVIGALDTAIAVVHLSNALDGMLPDSLSGQIDWLKTAFEIGRWAVYGLAFAFAALAVAGLAVVGVLAWVAATIVLTIGLIVGIVVVSFALLVATVVLGMAVIVASILIGMALVLLPFILIGAAIYLAITQFDAIKAAALSFGASAASAAKGLIDGLVNGITSGAGMVYDAIKGLAAGAIGTLKNALGIHSPSTVFALAGSYTADGFAEGVEGNDAPQHAVESMAEPPDSPRARARGQAQGDGSSGKGGGNTYYVTINAPDGSSQGIVAEMSRALTGILEGDVIMLGGAEAPAT